jgi:hypothetical protein
MGDMPVAGTMTVPLSTLPTGTRFHAHSEPDAYTKLATLNWDALRDSESHDLYGVDPQVAERPDAVYCVRDGGVLVLMLPDAMVEPLPPIPPVSEYAYRVTTEGPGGRRTYGVLMLETVQTLIRTLGMTTTGIRVAIEHEGRHINADGTLCKEQGKGLQWRNVQARVAIGSVNV